MGLTSVEGSFYLYTHAFISLVQWSVFVVFHIDIIKAQLKDRKNGHVMLVDGMSKLTTYKVKTCQSTVFQVSGHKWWVIRSLTQTQSVLDSCTIYWIYICVFVGDKRKLIIHPAGKDGTKDYLSFHLRIKDKKSLGSNWVVSCSLKLSVLAQTRHSSCHSMECMFCLCI